MVEVEVFWSWGGDLFVFLLFVQLELDTFFCSDLSHSLRLEVSFSYYNVI